MMILFFQSGMDKGTGQTAFIWMDKFTDITGKFRPVAFAGFQQYGTAVGKANNYVFSHSWY